MFPDFYSLFAASIQDGYVGNLIEIVSRAEGEKNLYYMENEELLEMGLTKKMVGHINKCKMEFNYEKIIKIIEKEKIEFIKHGENNYPQRLSNIPSAPYALFVKGETPKEEKMSVAIVGARECSEYGRLMAEYFGDRLARCDVDIVSGMAYGIDGIAQMAAIDAGGRSYAVLGSGVDVAYPAGNRNLYNRLANCGGIISEYVPGTKAVARNFPPRNRIISGLCDVLLVVEARAKSGTLITVDMATEQGRDVCVIPGRITDPLSVGCLKLIEYGAYPVTGVEDVLNHLSLIKDVNFIENNNIQKNKIKNKKNNLKNKKINNIILNAENEKNKLKKEIKEKEIKEEEIKEKEYELSEKERTILNILDYYPKGIEEILKRSEMDISQTMIALTELELRGLVKCISQGCFSKIT